MLAVLCSLTALQSPIVSRRAAVAGAASAAFLRTAPAFADYLDHGVGAAFNGISEYEVVPSQQAGTGKIDINNAFVTDYKQRRGMFPHAAGLIASNGPYSSVNDIMKLPGANENDKKLFAQYKHMLVALPPGRTFNERINARQST